MRLESGRSPARRAAAELLETDRTGKPDRPSSKSITAYKQDLPRLWVTVGIETVGRIYERQGKFGAFDAGDAWLGEFPTLLAARAAISAARHILSDRMAAT